MYYLANIQRVTHPHGVHSRAHQAGRYFVESSALNCSSRSLRHTRTTRTLRSSRRYTMRNGEWIISRRKGCANSGTMRPISGWSCRVLMRVNISATRRWPTCGACYSVYHCCRFSRSSSADSAKLIAARTIAKALTEPWHPSVIFRDQTASLRVRQQRPS